MPLRLVRRGRSPHWYVRGSVRGIRVFETAGTDDKKVAEPGFGLFTMRDIVIKKRLTCTQMPRLKYCISQQLLELVYLRWHTLFLEE